MSSKKETIKVFLPIIDQKIFSIEDINFYYYYLLIEKYLWNHRGYFTIDEVISILRDNCNYKSLQNKTNIYKFKIKLFNLMVKSNLFFEHVSAERFKLKSYRKILNNLHTSKNKSEYYHFPESILKNKQLFRDIIIGVFLLGHVGYSNVQAAKHFQITKMRVQQATRRNNLNNIILKNFRFVMVLCNDRKDAYNKRTKLWNLGIRTIIKEKSKKVFICCFRTNSYDSSKLQSHKSRVKKSAESIDTFINKRYEIITKNTLIFKTNFKTKFTLKLPNKGDLYYKFCDKQKKKTSKWTLDSYIQEYALF